MNILLINPAPSGTLKAVGVLFPPLGLLYLAAYMEREGHQVVVKDLAAQKRREEIDFKRFDIVGISTDTTRHDQALRLAKKAKANGCTVVMGGPHPSYVDEEILLTRRVDFIVRGEGGITFSELVASLEKNNGKFHSIQGISFLSNGKLVRTLPRPFIENLDTLPFPARHLINMDDYRRTKLGGREITPLITSRGCPYQCAFCSSSHFFGTRVRSRNAGSVLNELEEIHDRYHFNAVALYPGTAIYEQVKNRIFKWRAPWSFFDMQHLVFKHDHFSFIRMEWLLLKANLLYYTRSKKAIQDIWGHIKKHRLGIQTIFRFLKEYF